MKTCSPGNIIVFLNMLVFNQHCVEWVNKGIQNMFQTSPKQWEFWWDARIVLEKKDIYMWLDNKCKKLSVAHLEDTKASEIIKWIFENFNTSWPSAGACHD